MIAPAVAIELSVQPLMWNLVVCGVLALSVHAGKLDPDVFDDNICRELH